MKRYLAMLAAIISITPFSCSAYLAHTTKVNNDIDPRFGSMNDGLTMMRFESYERHRYKQQHGYDREDEGRLDNRDRYGYAWDSHGDGWESQYWREE